MSDNNSNSTPTVAPLLIQPRFNIRMASRFMRIYSFPNSNTSNAPRSRRNKDKRRIRPNPPSVMAVLPREAPVLSLLATHHGSVPTCYRLGCLYLSNYLPISETVPVLSAGKLTRFYKELFRFSLHDNYTKHCIQGHRFYLSCSILIVNCPCNVTNILLHS